MQKPPVALWVSNALAGALMSGLSITAEFELLFGFSESSGKSYLAVRGLVFCVLAFLPCLISMAALYPAFYREILSKIADTDLATSVLIRLGIKWGFAMFALAMTIFAAGAASYKAMSKGFPDGLTEIVKLLWAAPFLVFFGGLILAPAIIACGILLVWANAAHLRSHTYPEV